jgi:hypothetical protein
MWSVSSPRPAPTRGEEPGDRVGGRRGPPSRRRGVVAVEPGPSGLGAPPRTPPRGAPLGTPHAAPRRVGGTVRRRYETLVAAAEGGRKPSGAHSPHVCPALVTERGLVTMKGCGRCSPHTQPPGPSPAESTAPGQSADTSRSVGDHRSPPPATEAAPPPMQQPLIILMNKAG